MTVRCPFCDRRYMLDEAHLSRKVRCKKCETVFFPEDSLEHAAPKPDVYGFDDEPGPSWASSTTAYQDFDEEEDLPPVSRSSWRKPKSLSGRRSSRTAEEPIIPRGIRLTLLVVLGVSVLGLMFSFIGIGPGVALCTLAMLALFVLVIAGNLWFTVEMFRIGLIPALLAIFVPFYGLVMLSRHWESLKRPLCTTLSSGALLVLLVISVAFMNDRRGQGGGPGIDPIPAVAANMPAEVIPPVDEEVPFANPPAGPGPVGPIAEPPAPSALAIDRDSPEARPFQPFRDRSNPDPIAGNQGGSPPSFREPSVHEHRRNVTKVSSGAVRASSALGAISTRPHDEQHWRKLEEVCRQLTADVEAFQNSMPISDLDRDHLAGILGGQLGSVAGQLSEMTDRALQTAGQSPRASLIEVPRTLLAQVTRELGIAPVPVPTLHSQSHSGPGSEPGPGPRSVTPGPRFGRGPRFGPGPDSAPDAFSDPGFPTGRDAGAPPRPAPPSGFGPRGPRLGGPPA